MNTYRGAATMDVTRQSDGAMLDELDISGRAREVVSPDGTHVDVTLRGPSILFPNSGEEGFFAAAGFFDATYFTRGEVTLHITVDPETGTTTALTADVDAHRLIDICKKLDKAARHGGGHGDGKGDHHKNYR